MSRKIEFFVPGTPVGKGRPRAARRGAGVVMFTPGRTADYEALVATTAAAALASTPRALLMPAQPWLALLSALAGVVAVYLREQSGTGTASADATVGHE